MEWWILGAVILLAIMSYARFQGLNDEVHNITGELYALKKRTGQELQEHEEQFLDDYPGFMM